MKESANIFIVDMGHIKKDENLRHLQPSSFQRSTKQNHKQVILSNTSSIPVKLAPSEHGQQWLATITNKESYNCMLASRQWFKKQ